MSALAHLAARFVQGAYWYCVDFMVNLANLTHTAYPEANTWVLLLGLPGVLALLLGARVWQRQVLVSLQASPEHLLPQRQSFALESIFETHLP